MMRNTTLMPALLWSAVAILAATSSSFAQQALNNAGFEDPVIADDSPFFGRWHSFSLDGDQAGGGDTALATTAMPFSGAQALELRIGPGVVNSFAGVFQDVLATPGQTVTFSGWHKSIRDSGIEIRLEFRDSVANTEISRTPNASPTPGDVYEEFTVEGVVPAMADSARIVYAIQSFGQVTDQLVYVDDVVVIPEPTTTAMLAGLGLVGVVGLRRRRN